MGASTRLFPTSGAGPADTTRARGALQSLNFFVADLQAGIGPFLGIFLQQRGWTIGPISTVMTAGGVAGMLFTAPAGAFIDHSTKKRLVVVFTGLCTVAASLLILLSQSGLIVTVSQVATAIAGAAIGPAVTGMTLGIVRQQGFNAQNGRNQAFNHVGNMIGAGLSGWLGWKFGMPAIFYLAAAFGVLAIVSVLMIPEKAIDHDAARGLENGNQDEGGGKAEGFRVLLHNKPMLILAASLACFHLGDGAMLPLYGLAVVGAGLRRVAVPGLVAHLLSGTGRVNVGQGAVMTAQGFGAAPSPALGGWMAQLIGYKLAFFILGGFALGSLALWIGFAGTLRPACASASDDARGAVIA